MMPGPPRILTCPFCGANKEVLSLMSGNTFGAELWSDGKQIAPMLPRVSFVQKCPECRKYYLLSRQEEVYAKEGFCSETGHLTFAETKEAFAQIQKELSLHKGEETQLRFMLHFAYNDYYYRNDYYGKNKKKKTVAEDDYKLFRENAIWLLENGITDPLMTAEYYREIGEFKKASVVLDAVELKENLQKTIASSIRKRIDAKDCGVFLVEADE